MENLEKDFEDEIEKMIESLRSKGYVPKWLIDEVSKSGAVNASKKFVVRENTYGLNKLKNLGELGNSLEAHVLDPKYRSLFTSSQIESSRKNLLNAGYSFATAPGINNEIDLTDVFIKEYKNLKNSVLRKAGKDEDKYFDEAIRALLDKGVIDLQIKDALMFVKKNRNRIEHSLLEEKIDVETYGILKRLIKHFEDEDF